MVHVEFNGLTGSGKSTLYLKANDFLESKLGYRPGPDYMWTQMLQDEVLQIQSYKENSFLEGVGVRLLRSFRNSQLLPAKIRYWHHKLVSDAEMVKAHNFERLAQFIFAHREYFHRVLEAYPEDKYAEELDEEFINLVLEYFLILATHYQTVSSDKNRSWVMYDEGFCRDAVKYVIDDTGSVIEKGKDILNYMPKVDLLFYIDTDIETCISRLKTRPAGIPLPYRKFEKDICTVLKRDRLKDENFYNCLKGIGRRVVRIDNNRPIDESCAEVFAHLEQLYCEKNAQL
jgi:hypothetical protein